MIIEEIRNISSTRRDLRNFGLVVGGVLAAIGLLLLIRHRPAWPYLLWPGLGLAALGLLVPSVLKPLQKAWMAMAVVIGWVMTRVILGVLFYLVITPISIASRLMRKRWLALAPEGQKDTYWIKKDNTNKAAKDHELQY